MIVVVVSEIANPARYEAHIEGRLVVTNSATPFLDASRVLLAEGGSRANKIVMRRSLDGIDCLISTTGVAAGLTVDEHHLVFAPWKASPYSAVTSPVASIRRLVPRPGCARNKRSTTKAA